MKKTVKKVTVKKGKKPAGKHMMPDGKMMMNSDMKKKPSAKAMAFMKKVGMSSKK